MNSGTRPFPIVMVGIIALLPFAIIAGAQSFSLYSGSNMIPTNAAVLVDTEQRLDPTLPVIEMTNVPLARGIRRLMRQSHTRFIIDPQLQDLWHMTDSNGHHIHEPLLNLHWTNITASAALFRLLREQHLKIEQSPVTLTSRITYDRKFNVPEDAEYGSNVVSLLKFEDVPITVALGNLARAGEFNYILDPDIGYGETDRYGQRIEEPKITFCLTNAIAERAFVATCAYAGLVVARDPHAGVIFVRVKGHYVNFVNPDIYSTDTNTIPMIQFKDVPLSLALKNLARQAGAKCIFSPRIDTGNLADEPLVNLRWQNITGFQAFAAICESYDLDVIKYPVSGFIRVEPSY